MKHVTNKILCITAIVFLLGGCASSHSLRENAPTLQQKSLHNAKNVSVCIGEKWEKISGFNTHLSMMITKRGYSLEVRGEGGTVGTIVVADINDLSSGGSETLLYSYPYIFQPVSKKFPEAVISCQND